MDRIFARSRPSWLRFALVITLFSAAPYVRAQERVAESLSRTTRAAVPGAAVAAQDDSTSRPPQPGPRATITGLKPLLPLVQPAPPAPEEARASFIDSLKGNDAVFEVVVGQGRLLTLKEPLAEPNKAEPVVAVGSPEVIDFEVVGPRHIRLIGKQVGVTDLSVIKADGASFSFEVQVVLDLNLLRAQLQELYPDAVLQVAQIRQSVVVEGEATSALEAQRIIRTIEIFLGRFGAAAGQRSQVINLIRVPPTAGLDVLQARLAELFPDALITLSTIRQDVVVEGQARSPEQVENILAVIRSHLRSIHAENIRIDLQENRASSQEHEEAIASQAQAETRIRSLEPVARLDEARATQPEPQVINLLRVPGSRQVLLEVKVAELNRTALRQFGFEFLFADQTTGFGTNIIGSGTSVTMGSGAAMNGMNGLNGGKGVGALIFNFANGTTAAGVRFNSNGAFQYTINALRRNGVLKVLAEPNLVAYDGHEASFLAGGEFPVPVPQSGAATGAITVEFKRFGVQLGFVPNILDDETIRLSVTPEVSQVNFALGTEVQGTVVPGVDSRRAHTTVEMQPGQSLAIAGLLSLTLNGTTARIPGLGDVPVLGPFFSNNSTERTEKELIVIVTPHLVEAMDADELPPTPGEEVKEPNDLEFYLLGRIESRVGRDFRSTTEWDDPLGMVEHLKLERQYLSGSCGFSQ